MTTIKLRGPIDLEQLHGVCSVVSAPINIGADGGELTLLLSGSDAAGCAKLLTEWLELAGVELAQPIG